jgi:hypothetical protein
VSVHDISSGVSVAAIELVGARGTQGISGRFVAVAVADEGTGIEPNAEDRAPAERNLGRSWSDTFGI